MQKLIWKNSIGDEVDLTSGIDGTGPYMITEWEGFSGVEQTIQSQQVPFNDGSVYIDGLLGNRTLTVTLAIQDNNNLTTRYQLRRELIAALNPKLKEGYLIYKNDYIEKQIKCVPEVPIFETHNSDTSGTPKASLSWVACNPYWEDLEDIEVEFNDVHTINNAGDVPAQVKLSIPSKAGNPIIYNRTNSKQLELIGTQNDIVEINTNIGQKEVRSYQLGFKWQNGGTFNSCASSSKKIIFVGEQVLVENIVTGETTTIDVGDVVDLKKIIYVNNTFIAIGSISSKAMVLISTDDGETWQSQEITSTLHPTWQTSLRDIVFGDNKYVLLSNSEVFISTDLETWNEFDNGGASFNGLAIAFGNGIFVITAAAGYVYYSSDAETWNPVTRFTTEHLRVIVYYQNKFTIGYQDTYNINFYSSTDGSAWSLAGSFSSNNGTLKSIACGNGMYIAIGDLLIATSLDGETWNSHTASSGWRGLIKGNVCFANSYFYSLYEYGMIYKTKNGNSWEEVNRGIKLNFTSIAYGNNRFVAVGYQGYGDSAGKIQISDDGINWRQVDFYPALNRNLYKVIYAKGIFVAVGGNSSGGSTTITIFTSPDGENWTQVQLNVLYNKPLIDVFYNNGVFWAVGDSGYIFTSEDGIEWIFKSTSIPSYRLYSIACNGNTIVISAEDVQSAPIERYYYVSQDGGSTWQSVHSSIGYVTYGNGLFVAGVGNEIYTSTDGLSWNTTTLESSISVGAFYFIDDFYYTVSSNGLILRSSDGETWIKQYCPFTTDLNGIACKDNFFIAVGLYGAIVQSYLMQNLNLISALTTDSDMTFDLEVGDNILFYHDDNDKTIKLTYRQRYVGV